MRGRGHTRLGLASSSGFLPGLTPAGLGGTVLVWRVLSETGCYNRSAVPGLSDLGGPRVNDVD